MKLNKIVRTISVVSVVTLAISSAAWAVSMSAADKEKEKSKQETVESTGGIVKYKASKQPQTYEEYEELDQKLVDQISSQKLSPERVVELYKEGYPYTDIQYAEYLSQISEVSTEDILKTRGKSQVVANSTDGQDSVLKVNSKPWEDVAKELNIDTRKPTEKLGMSDEFVEELKAMNLSEKEIIEVGILAHNYKKNLKEIQSEMKQGKNTKELKKQYWMEKTNKDKEIKNKDTGKPKDGLEAELEKRIRTRFKITEEDIKKCKEYGITNIFEIGCAKDLVEKGNTSLEKVLKLKKDKKQWEDVRNTLGVTEDEE